MLNLDELNESQREAVICCDHPSLVIAGAGSGKTRVLTYKIAYLLEQGMSPWNILALTFTNKAAREMRERIGQKVGQQVASRLWMGTFHSIFSRILRAESQHIDYRPDFTIYDASDSKNLIKTIIKEMGLDDKVYKPTTIASRISMAKNHLILPSAYRADTDNRRHDTQARIPMTGEIYTRYNQRLRQSSAMDFDDLLLNTWLLFSQHPDIAAKWEERFHYVLVDEYQDTNYAQHQIIWLLTQHRQRLTVVGDDAQSIYSFRGANIDNILHFQERYPDSCLFKLEQNYRSTQTIVSAANTLISHNRGQIKKNVYSQGSIGEPITLMQTYSDIDEANAVVRCIHEFHNNELIPYDQIAILYRTNAQSRAFEEAMRKASIPYRVYGGLSFYQRKEIKDVIAYLRLIVNPHDEEALRRVINYPTRGIGATTLSKVFTRSSETETSPWEVLLHPQTLDVSAATKTKLTKFTQLICELHDLSTTTDAHTLALDVIRRSGMQAEINSGHDPDDITRRENLQELVDGIAAYVEEHEQQGQGTHLTDYLQEVSLLSDLDQSQGDEQDRVTLMTVHTSKGLEFRVVFVVGLEEDLFPSEMSTDTIRGLEEERRLFYVAITRAKEYLILSNAKSRFRYGKTEFSEPSRFLSELDPRYIHTNTGTRPRPTATLRTPTATLRTPTSNRHPILAGNIPPSPSPAAIPSNTSLSEGTIIIHERFGQGTIRHIQGSGIDTKATVDFDNAGTKQLLLRFAKFTIKQ